MMKRLSTLCLLVAGFFFPGQAQQAHPLVLDSVCAPLKVTTPLSDAHIGLSLLDNGEVRHYNYGEQAVAGVVYLSNTDHDLTRERVNRAKEMPFIDHQSPMSREYIRLVGMEAMGVYCIRTSGELAGGRTLTKVTDRSSIMIKSSVFIKNGKCIVVAAHGGMTPKGRYTYVSDGDGLTWKCSSTVTSPDHRGGGFYKGIRWNHGAMEPTVVEPKNRTLWMLIRTSQDRHYQAFSQDGDLTWSELEPSPFYGTTTMPILGRLVDGRLLLFWCNTTPLPEEEETNGAWDDVFTNHDVTRVTISDDDDKTWTGFRELCMDPMCNDSGYVVNGGGIDRGVHQTQFVEVAPGKVLASIGQHPLHRTVMTFDMNWLYKKSRFNNFSDSLPQRSTFNYIDGIKGHCAYNRIQGCRLGSHPEKEGCQVLHLSYQPDTSLVADTRGAVWNFPAMKKGAFIASLRIPEGSHSVSLLLNDRWMNPSDTVARYESMYELPLTRKQLGMRDDRWHEVSLEWDLSQKRPRARARVDGRLRPLRLPLGDRS